MAFDRPEQADGAIDSWKGNGVSGKIAGGFLNACSHTRIQEILLDILYLEVKRTG
jgi:hypothetical protein